MERREGQPRGGGKEMNKGWRWRDEKDGGR